MINIVVAMGRNRVIGKDNKLPWKLPEDLKRFKELTTGKWVVMGRKTYESIGKPLPDRTNVVITRHLGKVSPVGIVLANSLDAILNWGIPDDLYVIGGAEIYKQALLKAGMLYVTLINHNFEGDAFFPEIDESVFELIEQSALQYGGENAPYHYCYQRYRRKK
ncbi:MAG: dihydrofolate reductase [Candidatus Harrisonbacteria bacterium]|nr:dihydrofolate reductase [Candidatus Harrisonbacteria bacterium]